MTWGTSDTRPWGTDDTDVKSRRLASRARLLRGRSIELPACGETLISVGQLSLVELLSAITKSVPQSQTWMTTWAISAAAILALRKIDTTYKTLWVDKSVRTRGNYSDGVETLFETVVWTRIHAKMLIIPPFAVVGSANASQVHGIECVSIIQDPWLCDELLGVLHACT